MVVLYGLVRLKAAAGLAWLFGLFGSRPAQSLKPRA